LINCCFHLFLYSSSSFSSEYLLLFLKSSRSCVFFFFLLLSLPSCILQWNHEGGNFCSEYDLPSWLLYLGYYLEVYSSLLYVQELVHEVFSLIILSVFLQHHISKLSKYLCSIFLKVQISEPYKAMLQT
jgi:hypothetical protein